MSSVRCCAGCGRLQSYPVPICAGCGSGDATTLALPITAEIYSVTVVARAPTAALQTETPYAAVLVRGAAGGLLLLRWRGDAPPVIGAAATVRAEGDTLVATPPEPEETAG